MKTTRTILTLITIFIMITLLVSVISVSATELPTQNEIVVSTDVATEAPTEAPTMAPTEAPVDPSVPHIKSTESTRTGIKITWSKVSGAKKYRVFVKSGSSWKKLGDTKSTSFTYKNVKNNKSYKFTVRCLSSNGKKYTSSYDKAGYKATYYAVPKLSKVQNTTSGVKFTWKAVSGIDEYRVYVKRSGASGWTNKGNVTSTSYTHTSGVSGRKYIYTVRCVKDGKVVSSFNSTGKSITYVAAPKVTKLENTSKGTKLTWKKVGGAYKYRVFVKSGSSWKKLGDTKSTSFTYTGVQNNKSYTYTVRCCDKNSKYISAYVKSGFTSKYYSVPTLSKVENTTTGVKITWSAVSGVNKYKLYVKENGASDWSALATVNATSYTDTSVKSGTKYAYTVRCLSEDENTVSAYNSTGKSITYVATPYITGATLNDNDVTLKWNAVAGAKKYRVLVKSGSSWNSVGYTTGTKYTIKNLKTNTDYTYTVRCCNSDNEYISAYDKSGFTVKVTYIVDQKASVEENLLYEKMSRSICVRCGADITGKIEDETSEYFGMSKYAYHLEYENCNSNWRTESRWFDVSTGKEATEQQKTDANNIYYYNDTHTDQLEYRYHYSALCYVDDCKYGGIILATKDTLTYDNSVEAEMQNILDTHRELHRINGERTDGIVGRTQRVYQIITHPEIGHYELVVK